MFDLLGDLLSIDQYAMITVVSVSALGGFVMKQFVDSRMLVLLFIPAFLAGGLVAQFFCNQYDIVLTPEKDANAVVISAIGMMVALVVMMGVTRLVSALAATESARYD